MSKKTADPEKRKQPETEQPPAIDTPEPELAPSPVLIPPHYALREFSLAHKGQMFTQKKGEIITDQQKLNLCLQHNAPIAVFDPRQHAKCPQPKCGHVFAWDGNA